MSQTKSNTDIFIVREKIPSNNKEQIYSINPNNIGISCSSYVWSLSVSWPTVIIFAFNSYLVLQGALFVSLSFSKHNQWVCTLGS